MTRFWTRLVVVLTILTGLDYIAWRWIESDDAGTLVEFWVDDRPGGVLLRVVESGLAGLGKDAEALRKHYDGNSEGWEKELAAAERFVLGQSG